MVMAEKYGIASAPMTPQLFGSAGKEHMEKYGRFRSALPLPHHRHVRGFPGFPPGTNCELIPMQREAWEQGSHLVG